MEDKLMEEKTLRLSVHGYILKTKTKEKVNEKQNRKHPSSTVNGALIKRGSCEPKIICFD